MRVGLLLEGASLPRWSAEVVDRIAESDFVTIELLVHNGSAADSSEPARAPRSLLRKVFDTLRIGAKRRRLVFSLYQRWDRRSVDPSTDPDAMVDCSARFANIESMRVDPITTGSVHRFPADALERIRARNLDVLIRFGFNILRGEILTAARFGVWSYHHGDNEYYRGGPAYFWELVEKNPLSGAILQVLTEELDAGKILCKGLYATDEGWSHARNRVQPYWGASTFLIQKLRELHGHGWDHLERNMVKAVAYKGRKKIYSMPSNWEMLRWLAPMLTGKVLRWIVRRPTVRHWMIAIRVGAPPIPGSTMPPDMSGFRWIDAPKGHSYADPFVVEADGKFWVYFEDMDYSTQIGKISCAEVRDGGLGEARTVIEKPYHMSYPCIFRDRGDWYMIPETGAANTVDLYRCTQFPDQWQFERQLMQGSAVDTTIWIEDGVYWLFVPRWEPRGGACQLWLYSASSLDSEWKAHPANPISTDVRNARSAGAIFRHEGKLFRPSQDDSVQYGRSMTLNEIVVMDQENYQEIPRLTVDTKDTNAMKKLLGTHTYNRAGAVELIDGKLPLPAAEVL